jgi:hypothetical protein
VARNVGHGRPRTCVATSCQPSAPRGGCPGLVEPVAGEVGQVDATDERHLVVHDHELLVVAVHRPLVRVERALHAVPAAELVAQPPHVSA